MPASSMWAGAMCSWRSVTRLGPRGVGAGAGSGSAHSACCCVRLLALLGAITRSLPPTAGEHASTPAAFHCRRWQTRLWFAGEAASKDDAYTVHGAYETGGS